MKITVMASNGPFEATAFVSCSADGRVLEKRATQTYERFSRADALRNAINIAVDELYVELRKRGVEV